MRCPTLCELPAPPQGKTGWPWTEESPQLPDTMRDGRPWPRVSIVTPSYNQEQFIEETIRSVLLQGYPNLEYIITDGASSDGSMVIIRKYKYWLAYCVSEPDRGQSHAINKGFAQATGRIYAWLNSDDTYEPRAVGAAVNHMVRHPSTGVVFGAAHVIDETGRLKRDWTPPPFDLKEMVFLQECYVPQVSTFFRQDLFDRVGGLDEDMYWTMDYDLWFRMGKLTKIDRVSQVMGNYREHPTAKTVIANHTYDSRSELLQCLARFFADWALPSDLRALEAHALSLFHVNWGLAEFQLGRIDKGRQLMTKAFEMTPTLVEDCRERILRSLVDYTRVRGDLRRSYSSLQRVFQHLPTSARTMQTLYQRAADRLLIIEAAQSHEERLILEARRKLLALLVNDRAWLKHRTVLGSIAHLYVRDSVIRKLGKATHCLRQRTLARPRGHR